MPKSCLKSRTLRCTLIFSSSSKSLIFFDHFDANVKNGGEMELLILVWIRHRVKLQQKLKQSNQKLRNKEYNICIAVRMNLDLVKQGPRQSWPRNTIDATEKVAPGSFFFLVLGFCFSFSFSFSCCVWKTKPDCAILCYHNFCTKFQTKAKICQSLNLNTW